MKVVKISILILLIAIVGLITYKGLIKRDIKPKFKSIKPTLGTIERKILVPGIIVPSKEIQIKSQISGVLDEMYVNIGDNINKGDQIAKIKVVTDPVSYERLERQYKIAQANYENRKLNYERIKSLYQDKAVTTPDYEDAEKQYTIALHEMQSIDKEMEITNDQKNTGNKANIIRSTTDGTILELPIKVGGAVMARSSFHEGTNIATIANLNSLLFQGKILESDINYLQNGMKFNLTIGALKDKKIEAELFLISPKGVVTDGSVKFDIWAKILFPKEDKTMIRAGYSANADLILQKSMNVLILNEKYIDFRNDSAFVSLVDTINGNIDKKFVMLGISDGNNVEILTGLDRNSSIKH